MDRHGWKNEEDKNRERETDRVHCIQLLNKKMTKETDKKRTRQQTGKGEDDNIDIGSAGELEIRTSRHREVEDNPTGRNSKQIRHAERDEKVLVGMQEKTREDKAREDKTRQENFETTTRQENYETASRQGKTSQLQEEKRDETIKTRRDIF